MLSLPGYALEKLPYDGDRAFVSHAIRERDRRPVIIKVMRGRHASPQQLQCLRNEHQIASSLRTRAIVRPLELLTLPDGLALVLEDNGGRSLDQLCGQPLELARFLPLAVRIAEALAEVHQGEVIHKDIKPHNIIVSAPHPAGPQRPAGPAGDLERAPLIQLTDFGISTRLRREHQTAQDPGCIEGSLPYMSPEQTGRMNRAIDWRTDLYSLGVTLYELLTGALPFRGSAHDPIEWIHAHVARAPVPPAQLLPDLPEVVSDIVMRLMAKMAEERYQSARGVAHDLGRCLAMLREHGRIEPFRLAQHDRSSRFLVPQTIYGREAELLTLRTAWDRVAAGGARELILITGQAGIGKSTVVHELHRSLLRSGGFFLSGKFDQYQEGIPYAPLVQALSGLVKQLLAAGEPALSAWRAAMSQALGPEGRLITDVIPQVELIIGRQAPVAACPPSEAQLRFSRVFRRFLGVIAAKEHPLVLYLDDLQWADAASLRLVQFLVTHPDMRSLLLIGAYRDDEVAPAHPLGLALDEIRHSMTPSCLVLGPLSAAAVAELVAETLSCQVETSRGLAELVHKKTCGNPFFVTQFLQTLHREGLLCFDAAAARFAWDLARIERAGVTDNVVEMMAGTLRGLDGMTQAALRVAACLGNPFELSMLAAIRGRTVAEMEQDLWPALAAELIVPVARRSSSVGGAGGGQSHRFFHDRIQQAAFSLIPEQERPALHLRIGRAMLREGGGEAGADPFSVAKHLNAAVDLLDDAAERRLLGRLDLAAGRRARASGAFAEASVFLEGGLGALGAAGWDDEYDTAFALRCELSACAHVCGKNDQAQELLLEAQARARTALDRAEVLGLRAQLEVDLGRYERSVEAGIAGLLLLGIELPAERAGWAAALPGALGGLVGRLAGVDIAGLIGRPLATEHRYRLAGRILGTMLTPAYAVDGRLWALAAATFVEILLVGGHAEDSPLGYAAGGALLVTALSDYATGSRMGQLALALLERPDMSARKAMALFMICGVLDFWSNPLSSTVALAREGQRLGVETGDLSSACIMSALLTLVLVSTGQPLDQVESEVDAAFEFTRRMDHPFSNRPITAWRQALRALRGQTAGITDLGDASFDEGAFIREAVLGQAAHAARAYPEAKLMLAAVAGDVPLGLEMARSCQAVWSLFAGTYGSTEFALYHALILGAAWSRGGAEERPALLAALVRECQALQIYAAQCPDNFADKHALAQAELYRIRGEDADATRCYEQAIARARRRGFTHIEALAHEAAARFYASRGRDGVARGYLEDAHAAYVRWGAEAKAERLAQELGGSAVRRGSRSATTTLSVRAAQLDTMAAVKASQAISTEIVLGRLTQALLQIVIDNAGAQTGYLITRRQDQLWVEAAAGEGASGEPQADPGSFASYPLQPGGPLPHSIIEYAGRTGEKVLLADGAADNPFSADAYLVQNRPRSVLCLPMLRQGRLCGLLYLENNLLAGAFTTDRIALLEVLVTQAAISIENARLYEELEQRVQERTRELRAAQKELVSTARKAGMAEIATGILHNVGNALNSVNISVTMIDEGLRRSKVVTLSRTAALLREHDQDMARYLSVDPKGKQVPGYLVKLAEALEAERQRLLGEVGNLVRGVDHLREIVRTQQSYAGASSVVEEVRLADVMEDALRMTTESLLRHEVKVEREYAELPLLVLDKHKLLQILINLMSNAKRAMDATPAAERVMTIRIGLDGSGTLVRIAVVDRGVGIAQEHLARIFSHGFTTKAEGHGFGLHSSALAAQEMKGALRVHSAGLGQGATFTLELPLDRPAIGAIASSAGIP